MSRSIHTTRRHVERLRRERFGDGQANREAIGEAERALEAKRSVKRHHPPAAPLDRVDADTIPVLVEPERRTLVHPVGVDDVRALLRRLPRGTLDGLTEIRLCVGLRRLRAMRRSSDEADEMGRPVFERLPGVFAPPILGTYFPERRRIEIYAHAVTDPQAFALVRPLVRAWGLATLAHEIGHHEDLVARTKRDRWRGDEESALEHYAERVEHAWGIEHVLTHVAEAHGAEVATLLDWIEHELGAPLPLATLVGDPRTTSRRGLQKLQWGAHHALATLLRGEGDRAQVRVAAATDLMIADEYDKALAVLDAVLEGDPWRVEARALRADVLQSAGREVEALALAEQVLQSVALEPRAIRVVLHGLLTARRWEDLLDLSTRSLQAPGLKRHEQRMRSLARARALLELGRWREMDETVDAILSGETSRFFRARANGLRALSLLRRGDARAALELAEQELTVRRQHTWWHYVLDAVRFEALHTLTPSGKRKPLPPGARKALTGMRLEEWVRQLGDLGAWGTGC